MIFNLTILFFKTILKKFDILLKKITLNWAQFLWQINLGYYDYVFILMNNLKIIISLINFFKIHSHCYYNLEKCLIGIIIEGKKSIEKAFFKKN